MVQKCGQGVQQQFLVIFPVEAKDKRQSFDISDALVTLTRIGETRDTQNHDMVRTSVVMDSNNTVAYDNQKQLSPAKATVTMDSNSNITFMALNLLLMLYFRHTKQKKQIF